MAGVVLIAISVAGGLGFSCLIGIKFNAASAQVSLLNFAFLEKHCLR